VLLSHWAGSMEAVYRPFHDETEVRTLAYDALRRMAVPRFVEARDADDYLEALALAGLPE
jgi:hypothetical protein